MSHSEAIFPILLSRTEMSQDKFAFRLPSEVHRNRLKIAAFQLVPFPGLIWSNLAELHRLSWISIKPWTRRIEPHYGRITMSCSDITVVILCSEKSVSCFLEDQLRHSSCFRMQLDAS